MDLQIVLGETDSKTALTPHSPVASDRIRSYSNNAGFIAGGTIRDACAEILALLDELDFDITKLGMNIIMDLAARLASV